ncbi:hypothetical protein STANM309S_00657 [Streptomyces tanashiensis]
MRSSVDDTGCNGAPFSTNAEVTADSQPSRTGRYNAWKALLAQQCAQFLGRPGAFGVIHAFQQGFDARLPCSFLSDPYAFRRARPGCLQFVRRPVQALQFGALALRVAPAEPLGHPLAKSRPRVRAGGLHQ